MSVRPAGCQQWRDASWKGCRTWPHTAWYLHGRTRVGKQAAADTSRPWAVSIPHPHPAAHPLPRATLAHTATATATPYAPPATVLPCAPFAQPNEPRLQPPKDTQGRGWVVCPCSGGLRSERERWTRPLFGDSPRGLCTRTKHNWASAGLLAAAATHLRTASWSAAAAPAPPGARRWPAAGAAAEPRRATPGPAAAVARPACAADSTPGGGLEGRNGRGDHGGRWEEGALLQRPGSLGPPVAHTHPSIYLGGVWPAQ